MQSPTRPSIHRCPITAVGALTIDFVSTVGDIFLFALRMLGWLLTRRPPRSEIWPILYRIGVQSLPVVMITGMFIGMVLAVQTYSQFKMMHLETRLGAVINVTLVKELGPVLAATMLAGRVGCSIAAELGTMRVTEQIDALRALGANPIRHLVVPRFLACVLMIPLLTAMADGVGILGGWLLSTQVLGIDSFHYWYHANYYVVPYDLWDGLIKSLFFGAAIAVVSCHRGFHCGAGAEGVGRAATEAFVYSFVMILGLDFLLGVVSSKLYRMIADTPITLM